ncbi:MAG: glycosyltransferase family 4 protein [Deltaproteobacteria bacterium]|nr:glycosyltransferase family 4 protein [Deltaproteobacteria bacterium]
MIRILHIHTMPVISGSGINTYLSMDGMDRQVYEVELACAPGGRLIDLVQDSGMEVRIFRNLVQPLSPYRDLRAAMDLFLFLRKNPYHVVHTHNSKAGFVGRLAAAMARVPVIVHTVHGFAFHDQEPRWRQVLFLNLERLASHWCQKMIFISQPLLDWGLKEHIVPREKTVKIYSGIQLEHFHPVDGDEKNRIREKWKLRPEEAVIGIVSKLWEGKGHATLIEAVKELTKDIKDVRLVIVGEGYLQDELVKQVARLGLGDRVLFTGFQMDVSEIIATFDVAVLPSFFEGMGRVILEAMAMAKPVVASRVGGIPDLVEDGRNGFLVQPGDVKALAAAIKRLLTDKELAGEMGSRGRKMVDEKFNSDIMVRSIEEVYRHLLTRKGIRIGP